MPREDIRFVSYQRLTKSILNRLNKINDLVVALSTAEAPLSASEQRTLRIHLEETHKKQSEHEELVTRILEYGSPEEAPEDIVFEDQNTVNDLAASIISLGEPILPAADVRTPSLEGTERSAAPTQHVKLPKLELKHFSGTPLEWISFINLFNTTVHDNPGIGNVTKLQYLLSILSGEPLKLVSSLSITPANYLVAYDLLHSRYHNKRRLTTLHLNHIMDMPAITSSSPKGLRQFITTFYEHSEALKALECDITSEENPLLAAMLLRKLDQDLRRKLEAFRTRLAHAEHTLPSVKDIIRFLNEECAHTEDANLHSSTPPSRPVVVSASTNNPRLNPHRQAKIAEHRPTTYRRDVAYLSTSATQRIPFQSYTCFACKESGHKIYTCPTFEGKSPQERHRMAKTNLRCISCLGNHDISKCTSKVNCFKCNQRHHTMLHFERTASSSPSSHSTHRSTNAAPSPATDFVATSTRSTYSSDSPSTVLLGTTLVQLTAPNGRTHVFRALLDSGSMCDFISERAAQLLGSSRSKKTHTIIGISQTSSQTKGFMELNLSSLTGFRVATRHQFHILDKISAHLPRTPLSSEVLKMVKPYTLADPTFHIPSGIDVLLGGALFPSIFTQEAHALGSNMPYMIGTVFGFVVMGTAPCKAEPPQAVIYSSFLSTSDVDLHSSLQNFWQQEEPPVCTRKSVEEQLCDVHFDQTHSRNSEGRYIVRLPFKSDHPPLGSSNLPADRRLRSLEQRFRTQPDFHVLYKDFISEYISLGHMTKLEQFDPSSPHYFMPHHGVLKISSSTTKLRTVFDASSKTSSGVSLNDILLTGRKLQTNICDILLHFRMHKVVFSCDIRQMYRQITIHPDDQKYQLILWRDDPTKEMSVFKLNTVTYGMNSSPYLAIKTLCQLADDEGTSFPDAANILRSQTYVDDIITGADSEEEALHLQEQLISLLRRGGFELRKWCSNSPRLLEDLPPEHLESPVFLQSSNQPHFTILGLHWSPSSDHFTYNLDLPLESRTKRQVLSAIAQIYDPCGFLSPVIMWAKCFMQLLWTTSLTWDDPLPPELAQKWQTFMEHAQALSALTIPRALELSSAISIELHGFSDASESGFAAVIFVRCHLHDDTIIVRQLLAKTRVAPLKKVTLPRLELCGAHLLGQLVKHCLSVFHDHLDLSSTYLWCDSSVVLTWLQTPSYKLKTYVANRVSQTQEFIPPQCWRHIPTSQNPADCASRGLLASQLQNHPLWWTGPEWLALPSRHWPSPQFSLLPLGELDEIKTTPLTVLSSTPTDDWELLSKFSSWTTLQFVMAYILRFVHNCRLPDKRSGSISSSELAAARLKILQLVQRSAFSDDIERLKKEQSTSTRIQRLSPFLDPEGILRVGGRLSSSSLHPDVRHPAILPQKHPVVSLLIDHCHITHLHAGPQLTQALLSRHVWILSARSAIRTTVFKCIKCFRNKPRNQSPLMGDLPPARIIPARAFLSSAVDYCGPMTVKVHNLRSVRHIKVYLCVFVCLVTKAVHLEVVEDLTTDAFIASLTRFVSRRGLCSDIYSDCGTNFVGADAALRKVVQSSVLSPDAQGKLKHFGAPQGINFHFNPPAAPHQGGLWESAVKSAKYHLRRVMGDTILTLIQFITLVTQIEAMLNSRPLTPLSNDPADLSALSPGHFLIGAPLASVPESDHSALPANRLKQWQLVQAFHQRIWSRWQLEYLHTLQQRSKWQQRTRNLQVGELVLIHTPSPPISWPLARITAVHPGADGVVRVVDLKTQGGTLTRPAVKVFPLPLA